MYIFNYGFGGGVLWIVAIVWTLAWKCYSTWLAARRGDKVWFAFLIVLNTLGILDMIYVFGVVKKKVSDVQADGHSMLSKMGMKKADVPPAPSSSEAHTDHSAQ